MEAAMFEKSIRLRGITIVHSDGVSLPIRRGAQNILCDFELLLPYYQGGEEIRKLAERVLGFQEKLAQDGYRVGGNAPYGFVRVLLDADGRILDELPRGRTVRQAGCHVRAIPKEPDKIATWLQILEWKDAGLGFKRIAKRLDELGIPSPDHGRIRTDHGVRHRVSGKWHPNTVAELCRNPLIIGTQEYGKRSEGRIRRRGVDGPRLLEDGRDCSPEGQPHVIINEKNLRIQRDVGNGQFDRERWQEIQEKTDSRGQNQRGIPRAKDPSRYPLACRLVDLTENCGSILYGRTNQSRPMYTCGRYMKTSGAECRSNQVDAEAMLRFTLNTLNQLVHRNGRRDKLRQKLVERARRDALVPTIDPRAAQLAMLIRRRDDLQTQRTTIEYRMARERDDSLYAALARQFQAAESEYIAVETMIRDQSAAQSAAHVRSPEVEVDAAMALLDDLDRITTDQNARAEINSL
jgi:hypothetical protein